VLVKDWDGRDRISTTYCGDGRFTYETTKFWKHRKNDKSVAKQ
jgi:hypothetical protein